MAIRPNNLTESQRTGEPHQQVVGQNQHVDESPSPTEDDVGYVESTVRYFRQDGWELDQNTLRDGVAVLTGVQQSVQGQQRLLCLVVTEPEGEVTAKHLKYLIKTGQEKNVDTQVLTATVDISDNTRSRAPEYDVEILEPQKISNSTGSPHQSSEATAPRSGGSQSEMQQHSDQAQKSASVSHTATNSQHQAAESRSKPHDDGYNNVDIKDTDSPLDILKQPQGKQCLKYTIGIFAAIGLGYGVGLILLSMIGSDIDQIMGLLALMIPIFGAPLIAVLTGNWVGQNVQAEEQAAAVASATGAFLGFFSLLIILLIFSSFVSGSGDSDIGSTFGPLLMFGIGVSVTAAATTVLVRRIDI